MNEFNLLTHAEKIAYCRAQLRRTNELEAQLRTMEWSPDRDEAMAAMELARRNCTEALRVLEKPSLWRRLNLAVNDAWARSQTSEDLKRRRKPVRCVRCHGSGRRVGDYGNYFVDCECRGHVGTYDGDPEVDRAMRAAAEARRMINETP